MNSTKEMYSGCLYLFEGESTASSCFIQSEEDASQFIILANYYLKDFLKIIEFNLNKDSWLMLVKIRSKKKVFKSYLNRRDKSKTCNRKNDYKVVWKIISEQMRQFLKHYVTDANSRSGREGTLVKAPYKRSYFDSLEEVKVHIENLRKQLIKRNQKVKKYRGRRKFYKIAKNKIQGHILLSSSWKKSKKKIRAFLKKIEVEVSILIDLNDSMSQRIIMNTKIAHTPILN